MQYLVQQESVLLDVLHLMAPESSKNTLRSWLQSGRVSVDHQKMQRANHVLKVGQMVEVGAKVSFIRGRLRILYDDDHLIVLEKPEGLLSVSTDFETRATVHAMLKKQFHSRQVYPVHRLDRDTSGVMLFAYTDKAREGLKAQFEKQQIEKTYFSIVEGAMPLGKGTWESYLEEDDFYYVKSTNDSLEGKLATTHYEVLKAEKHRSFLRLHPKSGRKNQLRVHCSESGHPIVGDKKYRAQTDPLKRLCLHAQQITFIHPITKRQMSFSASLPENFFKIMALLRK